MDEIRVITWTVSDDGLELLPEAPQFGGVQGEDNATLVRFAIGEGCPIAKSDYHLYIEVVDATGAWDRTDRLYIEGGYVTHTVPLAWTQHGGTTTLRLQAEKDGQTIYSLSGMLRFDGRETAHHGKMTVFRMLVQKALDELRAARQEFRDSIDDHLDAESINPVQNQVVTKELNSIMEYADSINEIAIEAQEAANEASQVANDMNKDVAWLMEHRQAISDLQGFENRINNVEQDVNNQQQSFDQLAEREEQLEKRVGVLGNSVQSIETQVIPEYNERISNLENEALTVNDVDAELSTESENPVQNKAVMQKISQVAYTANDANDHANALDGRMATVEKTLSDTEQLVNDCVSDLDDMNGRINELENTDVANSVNGQTGAVQLTASDVGARPNTWIPSHTDVGADKAGTANTSVATHNTNTEAHNDIRLLIAALTERLNTLANSDDDTLDQMAEVASCIKANRGLIEQVTTGKVSVADIVNNLTTNVTDKPLSAAQGVALKALIDELAAAANSIASVAKTGTNGLVDTYTITYTNGTKSTYTVTNGADGATGERGMGMLYITTAPSSYTTATGGFTPVYRIALSTVLSQSKASRVLVGDTLVYSYYLYPVGYVDASYVYLDTRKSLRGANGTSVTVSGVSESTESGGENVVTFSDGKTLAVKNGRDGENGTTPAKGTDYFTAEDKAEMVAAVKAAMTTETWTFTLEDGSTVTKKVVLV